MMYDSDTYAINKNKNNVVTINKYKDVVAFNKFQYIKSSNNIYCLTEKKLRNDISVYLHDTHIRETPHIRFNLMTKIGSRDGKTIFKRITEDNIDTGSNFVINQQQLHRILSSWPSIISIRNKPKTYNDGSAIGHVRKSHFTSKDKQQY